MWRIIKLFFSYSSSEQKRIIALVIFAIILIVFNKILVNYNSNQIIQDKELVASWKNKSLSLNNSKNDVDSNIVFFNSEVSPRMKVEKKLSPFNFNPNNANEQTYLKLGFTQKEAQMILKFRSKLEKGFEYKEQFGKIYCVDDVRYAQLENFINLPSKADFYAAKNQQANFEPTKSGSNKTSTSISPVEIVELNSADTLELVKIKGIGPYFARSIYKYREKLGGFHHKKQLLEVYRFTDSLLLKIESQISIDNGLVRKININQADDKEMFAHPYFRNGVGNAIFNYRKQHGPYQSISDLYKLHALDKDKIEKIIPYISLE